MMRKIGLFSISLIENVPHFQFKKWGDTSRYNQNMTIPIFEQNMCSLGLQSTIQMTEKQTKGYHLQTLYSAQRKSKH